MPSNTARIAKNTLMLYFRQILIMLVSLYTVRVVLETLGAEDYGIYNVVAGVVTMFSFLSGSMAIASQRVFAFELGRGGFEKLKKLFSLIFLIYVMIGILVLLLAETAGLWFVNNTLTIPPERKYAALWVYQFSIISFLFTILTSPYMAMIIAHEEMNIYAYVSIVEVSLKLVIVFMLRLIMWDRLALYGLLMLAVAVINTSVYRIICIRKYKECSLSFYWNKDLFRDVSAFTGWYLFGSIAWVCKNQGLNILLNQFFNPIIVAARTIASQVNNAAASLSQNFTNAIRPQIVKNYAAERKEFVVSLMFLGSKGSYLLMYLFVLPLVLEMPAILRLWLKDPPEYAVLFTRLVLLDVLIDSMSYQILIVAQATGKIKMFQSVVGGILFLNIPVSWILLRMGASAYSVLIVTICITFFIFIARFIILKRLIDYSIRLFFKVVLVPIFIISILSAILPVITHYLIEQNILRLCFVTGLSVISVAICSYYIGLNKEERKETRNILKSRLEK
jgi:O-antigen/teichoic acid export membrane protein